MMSLSGVAGYLYFSGKIHRPDMEKWSAKLAGHSLHQKKDIYQFMNMRYLTLQDKLNILIKYR